MNPRVSRSSALASKATGFPIAKIAAKVAIGYTLDEIPNDITRETPASFEPTLDYIVVKVPRFAFEKFPAADPTLTTHMKSVGEAMAIGRNFTEALQKALRSLEDKKAVFDWSHRVVELDKDALLEADPHAARRPAAQGDGRAARRGDPGGDPRGHRHRPVVRRPARADQRGRPGGHQRRRADPVAAAPGQAARLLRRAARPDPRHEGGRRPRRPARARRAAGLQDGRHLRGRVRRADAVPLLLLRRGDRGRAARARGGDHPRLRAQPDRPGHRVRLLLRARQPGAARGGLRDRDGQLQPRDGLDRLRHLRPALLRAAHPRGRARDRARREPGRPDRRRHLPARRPDAARSRAGARGRRRDRSSAPRPGRSTSPRSAARSAGCSPRPG